MEWMTLKAGCGQDCTINAWRRKARTEVYRARGLEQTRKFMAHRAGSNTLEKYYDEWEYDLDVTTIMLGEDYDVGAQALRSQSHPALIKCDLPPSRGFLKQSFISIYIYQDREYQKLIEDGQVERAHWLRKEIRRIGTVAFKDYHEKSHRQKIKIDDSDARKL